MFSAILADAFQVCDDDCFPISYRVYGNLFNRWVEAKSKIQTDVLDELLNADCVAKNVLTEKMQETMYRVLQVCDNYDLTIRKKKNGIDYSQHLESAKWSQPSSDWTKKLLIKSAYL